MAVAMLCWKKKKIVCPNCFKDLYNPQLFGYCGYYTVKLQLFAYNSSPQQDQAGAGRTLFLGYRWAPTGDILMFKPKLYDTVEPQLLKYCQAKIFENFSDRTDTVNPNC